MPAVDPVTRVELADIVRGQDWRSEPAGYAHQSYILSLARFGKPVYLPRSRGRLLVRRIPGAADTDAIGSYPLFAFLDPSEIERDLTDLSSEIVSVGFVPDLFSVPSVEFLNRTSDVLVPFKTHYLVDLEIGFSRYMHRHHRRYSNRGLSQVDVEVANDPAPYVLEWSKLYEHLIVRHGITGLQAFTPDALATQLRVPGCVYVRALRDGVAVGGLVCYIDRGVAYAHLVSTTAEGQQLSAQYALYWTAIEYCRAHARWFYLGSVPGFSDNGSSSGLTSFKAGWATSACQGFFCGKIINSTRYNELCSSRHLPATSYFPAYRQGTYG